MEAVSRRRRRRRSARALYPEPRLRLLLERQPVADIVLHRHVHRVEPGPQSATADLAVEAQEVAAGAADEAALTDPPGAAEDRDERVALLGGAEDDRCALV